MNMNQIINMIIRQITRQLVRKGVSKGFDLASRKTTKRSKDEANG